MSTDTRTQDGSYPTTGPDERTYDDFEAITVEGEEVIIYHRDLREGWIQSADAVSLEEYR